jgi:hypothetical protein
MRPSANHATSEGRQWPREPLGVTIATHCCSSGSVSWRSRDFNRSLPRCFLFLRRYVTAL